MSKPTAQQLKDGYTYLAQEGITNDDVYQFTTEDGTEYYITRHSDERFTTFTVFEGSYDYNQELKELKEKVEQ